MLACNTVHLFLPQLEAHLNHKFVSLIDVTMAAIKQSGAEKIGLLASPTTLRSDLYTDPFVQAGIAAILPTKSEQAKLETAIRQVIAGQSPQSLQASLRPICQGMLHEGAQKIVLGCTELSVIFSDSNDSNLIDPLTEVTKQLIAL